jgi:hypothetical protein
MISEVGKYPRRGYAFVNSKGDYRAQPHDDIGRRSGASTDVGMLRWT